MGWLVGDGTGVCVALGVGKGVGICVGLGLWVADGVAGTGVWEGGGGVTEGLYISAVFS